MGPPDYNWVVGAMWRPEKVAGGCGEVVELLVMLWRELWLADVVGCNRFTLPQEGVWLVRGAAGCAVAWDAKELSQGK